MVVWYFESWGSREMFNYVLQVVLPCFFFFCSAVLCSRVTVALKHLICIVELVILSLIFFFNLLLTPTSRFIANVALHFI